MRGIVPKDAKSDGGNLRANAYFFFGNFPAGFSATSLPASGGSSARQ